MLTKLERLDHQDVSEVAVDPIGTPMILANKYVHKLNVAHHTQHILVTLRRYHSKGRKMIRTAT